MASTAVDQQISPCAVIASSGTVVAAEPDRATPGSGRFRQLLKRMTRSWLVLSTLVAMTSIFAYANAVQNGYAFDDVYIIERNPAVHGFGNLRTILLKPYWPGIPELYRPVTLLTFAADWTLFGNNPAVFHLVNILLHAAVTVAGMLLVLRLGAPHLAAILAALVFAIHPVHVEAVSNLVGRAELLAALFVLIACHLQISSQVRVRWRVAGISLCYLLGLGAKEIAVTLPALLLLLEVARAHRIRIAIGGVLRPVVIQTMLLAGVLACFLVVRTYVLQDGVGTRTAPYLGELSTADRLATAARLWPEYLRLLFWPRDLSLDWGPAAVETATWGEPRAWLGLGVIAGLLAAVALTWRRAIWIPLAVLWFAISILPVSQIFFPIGVLLAERTLYLPSVALFFVLPPLVGAIRQVRPEFFRLAMLGFAILLSAGAAHTWNRTPVWTSTATVTTNLILTHPETWRAQWWIGGAFAGYGALRDAEPYYRRAHQLTGGVYHDVSFYYGQLLLQLNRSAEARAVLQRLAEKDPAPASTWHLLAQTHISEGNYAEALATIAAARSRAKPGDAAERARFAHVAALAHDGLGQRERALTERHASIRGDSLVVPYWLHLARLHRLAGESEKAAAARARVVALVPARDREAILRAEGSSPNDPLLMGLPRFRPPEGPESSVVAEFRDFVPESAPTGTTPRQSRGSRVPIGSAKEADLPGGRPDR